MVYSAGGYTGVQQYVATWAGDTGGGAKPLASMLNLAFSGHSNHSCDMNVSNVEGIHFGFLQTWAQENNWDYWYQPWLLKEEHTAAFRQYDQLRYRLLPYLYSAAAEAALTGYPVMRAMPMVYPDDPAWDARLSQYMLGEFLLVSAFSKDVRLPAGDWIDFWSGKRTTGPATLPWRLRQPAAVRCWSRAAPSSPPGRPAIMWRKAGRPKWRCSSIRRRAAVSRSMRTTATASATVRASLPARS